MDKIELIPDTITAVPDGMIAAVATSLEMTAPPSGFAPQRPPLGFGLERLGGEDVERYIALYRAVGESWLWYSRLLLSPEALVGILDDRNVEAYAFTGGGRDIGILELDHRTPGETELAFFGLVPGQIGSGFGRYLMGEAISRSFIRAIRRLWVHTCTLDHPSALAFYRKAGFVPFARGIELTRDPRLTGLIPRETAPQVPLIDEPAGAVAVTP